MKRITEPILFLFLLSCVCAKNTLCLWMSQTLPTEEVEKILNQEQAEKLEKLENFYQFLPTEEEIIYTSILWHDPFGFFDTITILKGKEDQIKVGDAVMNEQGLVGIVSEVEKHQSTVSRLTKPNTQLSVMIKDTYAILSTDDKRQSWIMDIPVDAEIEIGDMVYTSGLTTIKKNIPVGTVEQILDSPLGISKKAKITLNVKEEEIYYLAIVERVE